MTSVDGDSAVVADPSPAPGPTRGNEAPRARGGGLRVRSGVLARQGRATARGRYLQHASPARPGRVDECVVQVKEDRADPTQPHSLGNPSSARAAAAAAAPRTRKAVRHTWAESRGHLTLPKLRGLSGGRIARDSDTINFHRRRACTRGERVLPCLPADCGWVVTSAVLSVNGLAGLLGAEKDVRALLEERSRPLAGLPFYGDRPVTVRRWSRRVCSPTSEPCSPVTSVLHFLSIAL